MPNSLARPLAVLFCCLATQATRAAEGGAELFKAQCAYCHGARGEGSKRHKPALAGVRSIAQLAKVVRDTMPETDPGSLTEAEASALAEWMHREFYSPEAQDRRRPPRVELARLTVDQYRYTVSDLIGSFDWQPKWEKPGGLKAEYYAGRSFDRKNLKIDCVEPELSHDFGTGAPEPIDAAGGFSARWSGGLLPTETGEHEVIVHCDHAVRVWVNAERKPLIDAWVKSGSDSTFRNSLQLTAGRPVRLRVEFTKAKQGVQDKDVVGKKPKPRPLTPAFIRLEWKRPGRQPEVIPARHLSPGNYNEVTTVATPFPPDDKSLGWVRGTTVSKQWEQAVTDSALAVSQHLADEVNRFAKTKDGAPDRADKIKRFARDFAERAFRRPLTEAEAKLFVDRFFTPGVDPKLALRRSAILTLVSPRFLYREVVGDNSDPYAVASRLSYALWDTMPDSQLLNEAKAGRLKTPTQVRKQAERMVTDPKATAKLAGFVNQWLHADKVTDLAKSKERFPGFNPAVAADLRTSLELFIDDVLTSEDADFRRLLTAKEVYLNPRLAKLYGGKVGGTEFEKVRLDDGRRAGVLTHPFVLSAFAYTAETSPIHRGVFLARGVLGLNLKPPQEAFTPLASEAHPKLNTRERVALQTRGTNCQTCHSVINPLGFALEEFDAIGRVRTADNGKPVDSSGGYLPRDGKPVEFHGARDLANYLVASPEVHDSFVRQLFHHLAQQPVRAYGADEQDELRKAFTGSEFNIRKLAVEAAVEAALTPRTPPGGVATR